MASIMNFAARRYLSVSAVARSNYNTATAVSGSHKGNTIIQNYLIEKYHNVPLCNVRTTGTSEKFQNITL